MRTDNEGWGLWEITFQDNEFVVGMAGFTEAGAVGGYLWPNGPLPSGVQISAETVVTKPTQYGSFRIKGVTEAAVKELEPYAQYWFRQVSPLYQERAAAPQLVQNIRIWFKAFIPDARIEAPGFGCFHGDGRSFSNDINASARMTSEVTLSDLYSATPSYAENHFCGQTIKIDCDSGSTLDYATATTDMMHFFNFRYPGATVWDWDQPYRPDAHPPEVQVPDEAPISISYKGNAADPLVTGAPLVDMWADIEYDRINHVLTVSGKVDAFPAFEAYASWYGGPGGQGHELIYNMGPDGGPFSLFGDANRPFNWSIGFRP
jgi:hypothetical protein